MRTHAEITAIFERAKTLTGIQPTLRQRVYNPAGLICTEFTVAWNGHEETAHNTQDEVDAACDRLCDHIEATLQGQGEPLAP